MTYKEIPGGGGTPGMSNNETAASSHRQEHQLHSLSHLGDGQTLERSNHPIRLTQLLRGVRPKHSQHTATRPLARTHTRRSILHHHTLLRQKSKQLGPTPIRLRIRLAPLHHVPTDEPFRKRE